MKEESRIVEETRQKIASGELTYDQMKEKLIAAINKEYEKEGEPNIELINACEELLAELATDGQTLPESHQEKYGEVIRQNIQVSHHARNRRGFAKRLAVSLVVLVLLLGGGQVFLHREWFEHGSTDDEQQHIVQGFEIDPGLVAKAIAAGENRERKLTTQSYQEVQEFLGFDLPFSLSIVGWEITLYRVEIQPFYVKATIRYKNNTDATVFFVQTCMFSDTENAYAAFEQNREGTKTEILGIETFCSQNEDNNVIIWLNNNCVWRCHADVSFEEMKNLTKLFIGGYTHE